MEYAALITALEPFIEAIAKAIISAIQGQATKPTVMTDVKADPGLQQELQNDLDQQISVGTGQSPV